MCAANTAQVRQIGVADRVSLTAREGTGQAFGDRAARCHGEQEESSRQSSEAVTVPGQGELCKGTWTELGPSQPVFVAS